jgi:hypothetical protein
LAFGLSAALALPPAEAEPKSAPHLFPAGTYVLGGGARPATGADAHPLKAPFALHPDQYVLSGGPRPTDPILVDDDLEVLQGKATLFLDDDHVRSNETRPGLGRTYDGTPIILALRPGTALRVRATDHGATEAVLGDLYLHRCDGARWRLAKAREERSNPVLPHVFFDETFDLTKGFETPLAHKTSPLTARQLDALWADLGGEDAGRGFLALWALAGAPEQAVPYLKERLRPEAVPDARERERIVRLIVDLDSDTFAVREKASAELAKVRERAAPALRDALTRKPSAEARKRIEQILGDGKDKAPPPARQRESRAVLALQHMRTDEARKLLADLAAGAPEARLTREARDALRR